MDGSKRFKDPIYGYIFIDNFVMGTVVDSAVFQRLRRIVQTSYAPLYASAVHNRFVHSLGVYHLGRMVVERLKQPLNLRTVATFFDDLEEWNRWLEIFSYACLLHDVGHAPFSHTGEDFYLEDKKGYGRIHGKLADLVNLNAFSQDIKSIKPGEEAKPHEVVSAIVGLKEFPDLFRSSDERSLFARCITGYRFQEKTNKERIGNCLIEMLNSPVIDVDKLDYLIRDAYITGFDTVKIDYQRLLGAVTIVQDESDFVLAYDKSAISVIENVIYAHDAEGHWIQTHPVVAYETYLLDGVVEELNGYFLGSEHPLFSLESLSEDGNTLRHTDGVNEYNLTWNVKLLSDDDVVFLLKSVLCSDVSTEYLARNQRRHAMWKSEAEYQAYLYKSVGNGNALASSIESAFAKVSTFVKNTTHKAIINEEAFKKIQRDYEDLKKGRIAGLTNNQIDEKLKDCEYCIKWLECFRGFCDEEDIPFDLLFLSAKQFNSSFLKSEYENTMIFIEDHPKRIMKFSEILTIMNRKPPVAKNFYYVYYKRAGREKVSIQNLLKKMIITATTDM